MNLTDSIKYKDSIIASKLGIIDFQNESIKKSTQVIDSLNAKISIINGEISKLKDPDFCHDLYKFLINHEMLVFIAACAFLGLVAISADWISYGVSSQSSKKSVLSLKYTSARKIFQNYLLWGVGSCLLAYIAGSIEMFKCTFLSAATIAFTWPILLPKIIKKLGTSEEDEINQPAS